jgi:hypothetical protein
MWGACTCRALVSKILSTDKTMRKNFKQSNLNRQCDEVSELCECHSNSLSAKRCGKQEAEDQLVGPQVLSTVVMKGSLLCDTTQRSSWKGNYVLEEHIACISSFEEQTRGETRMRASSKLCKILFYTERHFDGRPATMKQVASRA